jgi:hypothetical protein
MIYLVEASPPLHALLAGEIVHHARSALDHLIAALANWRGQETLLSHQFPICATEKKFKQAIEKQWCAGLSKEALEVIKEVQPFNAADPDSYTLDILRELDNTSKHRSLLMTTSAALMRENVGLGSPVHYGPSNPIILKSMDAPKPSPPTAAGSKIFELGFDRPTAQFNLHMEIDVYTAFTSPERVKSFNVVKSLQTMVAFSRYLVERFRPEFG